MGWGKFISPETFWQFLKKQFTYFLIEYQRVDGFNKK